MNTSLERLKALEDQMKEVNDYLFMHVVTPKQENEGKIKRRKKE